MSIELVLNTVESITPETIRNAIKCKEFHLFRGTTHIVCCVTLNCGFTVIGEAACANPEEFDADIGQSCALEDAERKIGKLLAYTMMFKKAFGDQYDH